jgi:hypothetical protein
VAQQIDKFPNARLLRPGLGAEHAMCAMVKEQ